MSSNLKSLFIGIDFGSNKCCVGVVHNGKVEIIENERGNKTTPSYVAFTDSERFIGDEAKDQINLNHSNTIYSVKSFLGYHKVVDKYQKDEILTPPCFKMNHQQLPFLQVRFRREKTDLSPEQVSSMLLIKMKKIAEDKFNFRPHNAVISVPASFNSFQRQATIDAGIIAGFEKVNLIDSPTSAALSFSKSLSDNRSHTVFIIDFGDQYLSVGIASVRNNEVKMKGICGTSCSSSSSVNKAMINKCIEKIKTDTKVQKVDAKQLHRIKSACEEAKHALSLLKETYVRIDNLMGENDFQLKMNRDIYESALDEVKAQLVSITTEVFKRSQINKTEIGEVLLVGGSTRIPKFQDIVRDIFGEIKIIKTVNADEAMAEGAAIQGALLSKEYSMGEIKLENVPHNTFTCEFQKGQSVGNFMGPERNPNKFSYTLPENMNCLKASLFEIDFSGKKWKIGEIINFTQKINLVYYSKFEILFSIDNNGILQCTGRGSKGSSNRKGNVPNSELTEVKVNYVKNHGIASHFRFIEIEERMKTYINSRKDKFGLLFVLENMCFDILNDSEAKEGLKNKANELLDELESKDMFKDKFLHDEIKNLEEIKASTVIQLSDEKKEPAVNDIKKSPTSDPSSNKSISVKNNIVSAYGNSDKCPKKKSSPQGKIFDKPKSNNKNDFDEEYTNSSQSRHVKNGDQIGRIEGNINQCWYEEDNPDQSLYKGDNHDQSSYDVGNFNRREYAAGNYNLSEYEKDNHHGQRGYARSPYGQSSHSKVGYGQGVYTEATYDQNKCAANNYGHSEYVQFRNGKRNYKSPSNSRGYCDYSNTRGGNAYKPHQPRDKSWVHQTNSVPRQIEVSTQNEIQQIHITLDKILHDNTYTPREVKLVSDLYKLCQNYNAKF